MKKSLLFIASLALMFNGMAQEFPKDDEGKIVYEGVVEVDGATKDQLYRQARSWFKANYMNDAQDKDVVYLSDSYLGEIAANPVLWMIVEASGQELNAGAVTYEIIVTVKDGKFKYKIYRFAHESQRSRLGSGGALENQEPECGLINMQQSYWDAIKANTHKSISELVEGLKTSMNDAVNNTENQDW